MTRQKLYDFVLLVGGEASPTQSLQRIINLASSNTLSLSFLQMFYGYVKCSVEAWEKRWKIRTGKESR